MRQAGVLAAAGLYALRNNVQRLAEDHQRAQVLARGLAAQGWDVDVPETNMVYLNTPQAAALQETLEGKGVRLFAVSPSRVRMVLHLDVDDAGVERALGVFGGLRG